MPLSQNFNAFLGASVFGVVCAATLYMVEHYRQDRRRHAMAQDLVRLNNELATLRRELDKLMALQKDKSANKIKRSTNGGSRRSKRLDSVLSSAASTTTEDYTSALDLDSSDLEFYDVSDDDDTVDSAPLEAALQEIDSKLDEADVDELQRCIERLQILHLEHPSNPELLWRMGKAHYKVYEKTDDKDLIKESIARGVDVCSAALEMEPELAEVHKWLAILIGVRTDFQPMKEKILDGHLFKKHVDAAIRLSPNDPALHHMLGRFAYSIADLKWYERKVASALFAEPPNSTYAEALEHFIEAERLTKHEWKENKLCIAKCKIKSGQVEEGVSVLEAAERIPTANGVDDKVDVEIKQLLAKHKSSR